MSKMIAWLALIDKGCLGHSIVVICSLLGMSMDMSKKLWSGSWAVSIRNVTVSDGRLVPFAKDWDAACSSQLRGRIALSRRHLLPRLIGR